MKKIIVILLCTAMVLALGACNIKQKLSDKISDKITEGIIDKALGDEGDVDIDEGSITFKGEDGEEYSWGTGEWPKGKAADLLPEFKKGEIISVMNSDTTSVITVEGVSKKDCDNYVEKLKNKGFENDATELKSDEAYNYYAYSNEDTIAGVMYSVDEETMTISISINE